MTLNNDFYTLVNTATYGQPRKRVRDRVEIKMATYSQITKINLMVQDPQIQEPLICSWLASQLMFFKHEIV